MILSKRHTGLVVRDLEQSIRFYEALGLTVWQREEETGSYVDSVVGIHGVRIEWAKMKCADGLLIELLQYHSHPDSQPIAVAPSNRLGCSHVAYTVDDVDGACQAVAKLGGSVVNPPALAPGGMVRVAYCHDPDGILMELVEEVAQHA